MGSVIFRADGGGVYSVAMGHVFRTVRLAKVLTQRGVRCRFVMKDYAEGVTFVREAGFPIHILPSNDDELQAAEITVSFAKKEAGMVFIDLRSSAAELVSACNRERLSCIVYEDVCRKDIQPTILINPTPVAQNEEGYKHREERELLLGIDYQVLDPALLAYARNSFSEKIQNIFLCFGGADPCNISSRVLSLLLEDQSDFVITLALGPGFQHHSDVAEVIQRKDLNSRVQVISNCNNLHELQARSDAAITAGGTLVYESISLNLPTLVLPSIYYEAENISPLIRSGLIAGMDRDVAEVTDDELNRKLFLFISDKSFRRELYEKIQRVNLAGGIERVADKIISLIP